MEDLESGDARQSGTVVAARDTGRCNSLARYSRHALRTSGQGLVGLAECGNTMVASTHIHLCQQTSALATAGA